MEKKFKHLRYEERLEIKTLQNEGRSLRYIAKTLGRSPNTISRELSKRKVRGEYIPKKAQHKAYWKRYLSKKSCMKVALDGELMRFVNAKLASGWSPERISGYLKLQGKIISTKAVYKFVYSRCLERFLFWRKNRKKGGWKKYRHTLQSARNFIDTRPVLSGSGHLEADFIVSSFSSWCLFVIVDRYTRNTWIQKLPNRKHAVLERAFQRILHGMKVKSITTDNDIAFGKWRQLESVLQTKIYFTHPYHSWEKGLVENTNRWIRTWVPKKRDLKTVSQEELQEIQTFLNTVPRKVIGFRSAGELQLQESKCPN